MPDEALASSWYEYASPLGEEAEMSTKKEQGVVDRSVGKDEAGMGEE